MTTADGAQSESLHLPRGFRQARCHGCGLPDAWCLCRNYAPLGSRFSLRLVLPRSEARSTTNTARLLRLWLPEATTLEVRGTPRREARSSRAATHVTTLDPTSTRLGLLFPRPGAISLDDEKPAPELDGLLIMDGTWSQASKLVRRRLADHQGPVVDLGHPWPSAYGLRRNSRGLCTLEAAALALGCLGEYGTALQLLSRFAHWVQLSTALRTGWVANRPAPTARMEHPALAALELQCRTPTHPDDANVRHADRLI